MYGKPSKNPTANETAMAREERHAMEKNLPKKRSKSPNRSNGSKSSKDSKAKNKRGGSRKRVRRR